MTLGMFQAVKFGGSKGGQGRAGVEAGCWATIIHHLSGALRFPMIDGDTVALWSMLPAPLASGSPSLPWRTVVATI